MAESENLRRIINPCILHLQKMGLELKCPICLNLLRRPILLPCNHILCSPCMAEFGANCPVCEVPLLPQDLRPAPQMENMVSIYRSMDAAFGSYHLHSASQVGLSDIGEKSIVEQMQNNHTKNLDSVPSSISSFQGNKRVQASKVETHERPVKSRKLRDDGESHQCVKLCSQNCIHGDKNEVLISEANPAWVPFSSLIDPKHKEDGAQQWAVNQLAQTSPGCPKHKADGAQQRDVNQLAQTSPGSPKHKNVAQQRNVNQLAQTSPGSPPSFGDMKDSDDDSNDRESEHLSAQRLSTKGMDMKEPEKGTNPEANVLPSPPKINPSIRKSEFLGKCAIGNSSLTSPAKEDHAIESLRQKNSYYELHDVPSAAFKYTKANPSFVCAFCQSSKESEVSGLMLHYSNGRALGADRAEQPNVLHVHRKCIEWAPQVYFVGETAMNLEAELARSVKIKCSSCGKKGAALGCYAKSCRRSFHVPCAVNVLECRWDCDNFLMLCPAHSAIRLPCEKSKSGKIRKKLPLETKPTNPHTLGDLPSSITAQSNKLWTASFGDTSKWVLCGSALSSVEKDLLAGFARLTGATVTKVWKPNVTHVIASTDDMGACSRTMKFLMGISNGRWIMKIDWIKACIEAKHSVDEEPYEVSLDIHGCCDGPKNGRLRVIEKAPKLFSSLSFYFCGDFVPSYKGYLRDLVVAAGGNVFSKKDMISPDSKANTETIHSSTILIYSVDAPQRCELGQESSVIEQRCQEAEAFAAETGHQVAPHTWLLESISACKLQPLPA